MIITYARDSLRVAPLSSHTIHKVGDSGRELFFELLDHRGELCPIVLHDVGSNESHGLDHVARRLTIWLE